MGAELHFEGNTLEEVIGQAVGYASLCWSETPHGVFDSTRASRCVDSVVAWIKEHERQPNLGLATTREMLDEIRARIDVDFIAGQAGGLDYATAKGHPRGR